MAQVRRRIALENTEVEFVDVTIASPSNIYNLNHDSFADFVSAEHTTHPTSGDGSYSFYNDGTPGNVTDWTVLNGLITSVTEE